MIFECEINSNSRIVARTYLTRHFAIAWSVLRVLIEKKIDKENQINVPNDCPICLAGILKSFDSA